MIKQMRKIILVLLLGAVFLPAGSVGATVITPSVDPVFGYAIDYTVDPPETLYDYGPIIKAVFTVNIYSKDAWEDLYGTSLRLLATEWVYTYQIFNDSAVSRKVISELQFSGLETFRTAGVIDLPDGVAMNIFLNPSTPDIIDWQGSVGYNHISNLLYIVSTKYPINDKDSLFAGDVYVADGFYNDYPVEGTGSLPGPGTFSATFSYSTDGQVPEPATLFLVGSGMLIVAGSRIVRKIRRRHTFS